MRAFSIGGSDGIQPMNLLKKQAKHQKLLVNHKQSMRDFEAKVKAFLDFMNSLQDDKASFQDRDNDRIDLTSQYVHAHRGRGAHAAGGTAQESPIADGATHDVQVSSANNGGNIENVDNAQNQSANVPASTSAEEALGTQPSTGSSSSATTVVNGPAEVDTPAVPTQNQDSTSSSSQGVQATEGQHAGEPQELTRDEVRDEALGRIDELLHEANDLTNEAHGRFERGSFYGEKVLTQEELDGYRDRFEAIESEINDIVENTNYQGEALLQGGAESNADLSAVTEGLAEVDLTSMEGLDNSVVRPSYDVDSPLEKTFEGFSAEIDRLKQHPSDTARKDAVNQQLNSVSEITSEMSNLSRQANQDFIIDDEGNEVAVDGEVRSQLNERFQALKGELADMVGHSDFEGEATMQGGAGNADLRGISHFLDENSEIATEEGAGQAFYDTYSASNIVSEQQEKFARSGLEGLGEDFRINRSFRWVD